MKIIRLSKSSIGIEEKNSVLNVLDSEFLGMGEAVQQFEIELANFIGVPSSNVVCVNTGTSALQLALAGLDIGVGDEVLVPSLTYVASFQAISATGAKPVACDINPDNLCLDLMDAEKRITPKTKAIMPVHYASENGFIPSITKLAQKHSLRMIEDAAHSFAGYRNDSRIGREGDVICFSFDGIKNITSGEGGAIVTSDFTLLERLRDGRLLGVEKDSEKRYKGERSWDFNVSNQGFRFHMSNIMAAIGREQLKKVDIFVEKRKKIVQQYIELLFDVKDVELLNHSFDLNAPHIFVIKVNCDRRDFLMNTLRESGIQCGIHYQPNHYLKLYKTDYSLPNTELIAKQILTLPLHVDLVSDDIFYIVNIIKKALGDRNA